MTPKKVILSPVILTIHENSGVYPWGVIVQINAAWGLG
ncbi:hypothetical protein FB480_103557 [Agrobacterium vitis]|nr:hypothetical protein FB480_103557 [Agrobacterium vitis]